MMYLEEMTGVWESTLYGTVPRLLLPSEIRRRSTDSSPFSVPGTVGSVLGLFQSYLPEVESRARHFPFDGHGQGHACVSTHASDCGIDAGVSMSGSQVCLALCRYPGTLASPSCPVSIFQDCRRRVLLVASLTTAFCLVCAV